ncbi:hypothetical protein [Pseudarthrobacter sp. LT1]|uniref:hypothetical protein n=1 Tax=Pseudarthrobacter sp. LT1 TaxID=3111450 RepID=UPI002D766F0E|nr:hypothetical protein [Pseudarthrobacter sp. LT1]WRT12472.1 hypothetical protein VIK36_13995 [Pseudarthrobacter sp. LT1]
MAEIPEGYEPAQNAAAKDHVMEALYEEFEKQGINVDADEDVDENVPELIGLADAVVEALLKVGVVIPEDLESPYSAARKAVQPA